MASIPRHIHPPNPRRAYILVLRPAQLLGVFFRHSSVFSQSVAEKGRAERHRAQGYLPLQRKQPQQRTASVFRKQRRTHHATFCVTYPASGTDCLLGCPFLRGPSVVTQLDARFHAIQGLTAAEARSLPWQVSRSIYETAKSNPSVLYVLLYWERGERTYTLGSSRAAAAAARIQCRRGNRKTRCGAHREEATTNRTGTLSCFASFSAAVEGRKKQRSCSCAAGSTCPTGGLWLEKKPLPPTPWS